MTYLYKLFLLFNACMLCAGAHAQHVLRTSSNGLRQDDILQKQLIDLDSKTVSCDSFVVNLDEMEIDGKEMVQSFHPVAFSDTLYSLESGNRTYFLQHNDSVLFVRNENNLEYVDYDMPEVRLRFPVKKGDVMAGYFHGLGMYCDKVAMRKFGNYTTKAAYSGSVILPDSKVLSNCLCLHTVRSVSFITCSADSMHAALPAFTPDSITNHIFSRPPSRREETYHIYAEGYRYPIIEINDVYDGDKQLAHAACYVSPEGQDMLYDPTNGNIRTVAADKTDMGTGEDHKGASPRNYYGSQDTERQTLTVTIENTGTVTLTANLVISDFQGIVYRKQSLTCGSGERKTAEISYSGLRNGDYALRIFCSDGNDYSEKMVIR